MRQFAKQKDLAFVTKGHTDMMQPWTKYRKLWETPNSCNIVNSVRIQGQEISAPFADATGKEQHTWMQLSERAVYVQQKSSA